MHAPRVRLFWKLGIAGAIGVLLASSPWWGIRLGRQLSWLEVERVEVSGVQLLAPHEVLEISGIRQGRHLLEDRAIWEEALEAHPVIARASIVRRLPGTLRIRIAEKRAVAFIEDEVLRPATGSGEVLPITPAAAHLDLPIVRGALSDSLGQHEVLSMLAEAERLQEIDPALMAEVSEMRAFEPGAGSILMLHPMAELLVPRGVPAERIAHARAVLLHLEEHPDATDQIAPNTLRTRLDLRFGEQIVVGSSSARELS